MRKYISRVVSTPILVSVTALGVFTFLIWTEVPEVKYFVRSIEWVRSVQNIVYHREFPPLSAADVGDGLPVDQITLFAPASIAEAPDGSIFISERKHLIWKVGVDGVARIVAGTGHKGSIDTSVKARLSKLGIPQGLAVDQQGRVYFADSYNDVVARVNERQEIEVVAGTGVRGFNGEEGPATQIKLNEPYDVAVGEDGSIFIIENGNHRLRMVTPNGIMSTLAGAGDLGAENDPQPARTARLHSPWGLFLDKVGNIYVADGAANRIRRVSPDGLIETVAGNGSPGYSGDGGPALEAQLNSPEAIFLKQDGSLLIEDEFNNVIRIVDADGTISTFYGTDDARKLLAGSATPNLGLHDPEDIIETKDGTILIADQRNHRIIAIQPDGTASILAGPNGSDKNSQAQLGYLSNP